MLGEQNHNLQFVKMSGAGNDFVIFDARKTNIHLTSQQIQKISHRKNIGCDQLIVIRPYSFKNDEKADCLMEIYNSDGSQSGACGNATRCVAAMLMNEKKVDEIKIQTAAGVLKCWRDGELVAVDMGMPNFDWQKIPLAKGIDPQKISLFDFAFACVNMGNPHAVSFIDAPLTDEKFFEIAPKVESHSLFPKKTNVEFAQVLNEDTIAVRVFERGAGETLACGSGACAVAVLAIKKKLVKSHKITIRFKGGDLLIEWLGDSVVMNGGYEKIFEGKIDADFLA